MTASYRRSSPFSFSEAPEGSTHVVPRGRSSNVNLRTGLEKILKRAGVPQWPKLFQNLRASRETELMASGIPAHVIHAWLGNSREVAEDHYLMVTDTDFEKAVQNPVQSVAVGGHQEPSDGSEDSRISRDSERYGCTGTPTGSRTPVFGLRTRRPGPLDDGGRRTSKLLTPDPGVSSSPAATLGRRCQQENSAPGPVPPCFRHPRCHF